MKSQISESVGIGHPDKIADQIADAILDAVLENDKDSQVACEVLVSKDIVVVAGEIFSQSTVDARQISSEILRDLDYDVNSFEFIVRLNSQSLDIRESIFKNEQKIGAGDQGIVYGFATNDNDLYLPMSYLVATELVKEAANLIEKGVFDWAFYDMKSLVSLVKIEDGFSLENLVFSIQHSPDVSREFITDEIKTKLVKPVVKEKYHIDISNAKIIVNSSGKFVCGGLNADSGLTNRKVIVDSYGTFSRHGGGGYSGKDLTKIDRLGAYYSRWICKNLVASGLCEWAELELSYFLGAQEPMSMCLKINENSVYSSEELMDAVRSIFPLDMIEIVNIFKNHDFRYRNLACYGHFGRPELNLPWERLDKVSDLKEYFKKKK